MNEMTPNCRMQRTRDPRRSSCWRRTGAPVIVVVMRNTVAIDSAFIIRLLFNLLVLLLITET
jgi:hypothetical protein